MAGCAGRLAVAAKLHFPEESLAQRDGRILILSQVGKLSRRWPRDSNGFQRSQTTTVMPASAISATTISAFATAVSATAAISTFAASSSATIIAAATATLIATAAISAFAFLSAGLDAAISTSTTLAAIALVLTAATTSAALGREIGDAE